MSKRSKFGEFMYDFMGGVIAIVIIFGTLFCCSDTVHSLTLTTANWLMSKDSTEVVKPIPPKDSVTVIKKDSTVTTSNADVEHHADTIHLVRGKDNLYYLPIQVDGIPMKFALDTGCSGMSMSAVEYLFLEHQGLIKSSKDQECISTLANGSQEKGIVTKLDSVKIGNKVIKGVDCCISPNQDAALLLGQDVLSKLGEVTIKYKQQILLIE